MKIYPFILISSILVLVIGCVSSIDSRGFNTSTRIHSKTNTKYDENGFDINGRDSEGFNKFGRDYGDYDREGFNTRGYNRDGYNRAGEDKNGFKADGIHAKTGTRFDSLGFNQKGFNSDGFDRDGYNSSGLNKQGEYKTVKLSFSSNVFIKNLKVDGFTVEWPTFEAKDFIGDSMVYYDVPSPNSSHTEVSVETEIIVEYTTFAMNGFGQHRNESSKKIKFKLPYTRGTDHYDRTLN
jgi:hypothetical protein